MSEIDRTYAAARLRDALPSWSVVRCIEGSVVVQSPTFEVDGMRIRGRDVEEVIQRVRNVERIWALALERAGNLPVRWPSAGQGEDKAPASAPAVEPVAFKPSGDSCSNCQSIMLVRTGTCQTCQSCGTTAGCS